jgi:hypothetical protein
MGRGGQLMAVLGTRILPVPVLTSPL